MVDRKERTISNLPKTKKGDRLLLIRTSKRDVFIVNKLM